MKEKKCEVWELIPRPLGSEGELRKLKKRDVRRENRTHGLLGRFKEKFKRNYKGTMGVRTNNPSTKGEK